MGEILPLLKTGAGAVGLGDDLEAIKSIMTIVELTGKWAASEWPGDIGDVKGLLEAMLADTDAEEVKEAFAKLGLEPVRTKVAGFLRKLDALRDKLPDWVQKLVTKVDSFTVDKPCELSWKPLNADEEVPLSEAYKLALGFKAEAEIGLTAGARWPGDDSSGPLLRVGAGGAASAKAGATIPFSLGTVGAKGDAGVALDLDYYFETPKKRLLVVEVAERLPLLPNPFDLDSLWEAAKDPDFEGAVFAFKGTANARVDVALAYGGDLFPGVNLDLGVKLHVGASVARGYQLAVRRGKTDAHSLAVTMTRSEADTREMGISIGIDIALPVVADQVQQILTKAVAKWEDVVAEVTPLLSPGTLLQKVAGAELQAAVDGLVQDDKLKAAMKADLQRMLGVGATDDSQIGEWLKGMVKGTLDSKSALLVEKGEAASKAVLAELLDKLPRIRDDLDTALRDKLTAEVGKLVDSAKSAFDGELKNLLEAFNGKADQLGEALQRMGAASADAVAEVDDALKPVREILEKYNTLLKDVVEKVKEAAKQKISIAIQAEEKRVRKLDVTLVGRFTDTGAEASRIFGLLTAGELTELAAMIGTEGPDSGFVLDPGSQFKEVLGRESKAGVEFVLFGFGTKMSIRKINEVETVVDGNGNISIDAKGAIEKRYAGASGEREVSFTSAIGLALTRVAAEKGGGASIVAKADFGVNVIYKDPKLTRGELELFVKGLVDAELVDADAGIEATDQLASWVKKPEDHPAVDMAAKLLLSGAASETLLHLDGKYREGGERDGMAPLTKEARRKIYDAGWDALEKTGGLNVPRWESGQKLFSGALRAMAIRDFLFEVTLNQIIDKRPGAGSQGVQNVESLVSNLEYGWKMLHGPASVIYQAGRAYSSKPGKNAAQGEWTGEDYLKAQDAILVASRNWLRTGAGKFIFWARADVHPRTLGLMLALANLAGGPKRPVKLILTHRPEGKDPVTVMLSGPETAEAG
jgi:hypothetical protein